MAIITSGTRWTEEAPPEPFQIPYLSKSTSTMQKHSITVQVQVLHFKSYLKVPPAKCTLNFKRKYSFCSERGRVPPKSLQINLRGCEMVNERGKKTKLSFDTQI